MSEFDNRVRDSAAVANLRETATVLNDLASRGWANQATADLITRLTVVTRATLGRLTIADRGLVAQQTLNELDAYSQELLNAVNHLASHSPDQDPDRSQAIAASDSLLVVSAPLPAIPIRTTRAVLDDASAQFDREVQSAIGSISEEVSSVHTRMDEVRGELEGVTNDATALVTELESRATEHVTQVENKSDSLLKKTTAAAEGLDRQLTNIQEDFRNSQADRAEEYSQAQARREKEYNETLEPKITQMEDFLEQARGMLEVVAGATMAGHYETQRDHQRREADRWRWGGIAAFAALISVAAWIFVDSQSGDGSPAIAWYFGRSGLLLPLGILVAYTLRQAGHHRRREEDMSRVASEIILLWPFMNRLPEDDRKALLLGITPLYFKGGITPHNHSEQGGLMDGLLNMPGRRTNPEPE